MPGISNNKFSVHALNNFVLLPQFLTKAKPHAYKFNMKHFESDKYTPVSHK